MEDFLIKKITENVIEELNNNREENYSFGVPIGVSNRHVHLSRRDLQILFGDDYNLQHLKDLNQIGEYACKETVTLVNNDIKLEGVRVLGPCRNQTQVEISKTDARKLKKNPPVRKSGDLAGSESIKLIGPKGKVDLQEGCIIATRHIHFSEKDADKIGVKQNERVKVRFHSEKSGVIENVYCKVNDSYVLEVHLDTDDANAFLVETGEIAQIIK